MPLSSALPSSHMAADSRDSVPVYHLSSLAGLLQSQSKTINFFETASIEDTRGAHDDRSGARIVNRLSTLFSRGTTQRKSLLSGPDLWLSMVSSFSWHPVIMTATKDDTDVFDGAQSTRAEDYGFEKGGSWARETVGTTHDLRVLLLFPNFNLEIIVIHSKSVIASKVSHNKKIQTPFQSS
ncbi:hypothetical protein MSAN_01349600 [Mycena sanguinolenta]|uniref:Uncharacterized protein n=1 Tax=Mycena sanguinolenta TaxID=230812 RepID=A0A8H6YD58_9AGAR|nr:hypothetical protein MSAN_01349600 [Mycena sanguinolenta]